MAAAAALSCHAACACCCLCFASRAVQVFYDMLCSSMVEQGQMREQERGQEQLWLEVVVKLVSTRARSDP